MKKIQHMFAEGLTKLFVVVGGFSVHNFCVLYSFEPTIPEELKK